MRKIILPITLALLTSFSDAGAQNPVVPGWLTVTLNSIQCVKATADDLLHFDGFGDEVYMVTFLSVANQYGATKYSTKVTSRVYGDTYRFPDRQRAGNVDRSTSFQGGITDGTQFTFRDDFPELRRLRLEAGDIITIIPTLWEWDNGSNAQLQASFDSRMVNSFQAINLRVAPILASSYGSRYDVIASSVSVPSFQDILSGTIGRAASRPIGMTAAGELQSPIVITLDSRTIERQRTKPTISSPNDIWYMPNVAFNINEDAMGNTSAHGIYTLRYSFNFEPDRTPPAPAPAPAPAPTRLPVAVSQTPGNRIFTTKPDLGTAPAFSVSGRWIGTRTSTNGMYPSAINFTLTETGEFIMDNAQTRLVGARGSYRFSDNKITGSYQLTGSGETFSFTGTFDPTTRQMTCTLSAGQGTWVVTQQLVAPR